MFRTIGNFIFGALLLLAGLAVSLHGAGLSKEQAASPRAGGQQSKSEESVRLARTMGEFISELDLFDNHLYGRVQPDSRDMARAEGLRGQIQYKNDELQNMLGNTPGDIAGGGEQNYGGERNYLTTEAQNYYLNVSNLESEISGMLSLLHSLESGVPAVVSAELLDGSLWRTLSGNELLGPGGEDLDRVLNISRKAGCNPGTEKNSESGHSATEQCGKPE
jgi:hypothetical protein